MNILMVCLGNICRSPLAEGILQHLSDGQYLGWTVDSAGTGGWHVGEAPDRRSIRVALSVASISANKHAASSAKVTSEISITFM